MIPQGILRVPIKFPCVSAPSRLLFIYLWSGRVHGALPGRHKGMMIDPEKKEEKKSLQVFLKESICSSPSASLPIIKNS